jgi:3D (Asp-Asp-Asp) domain-containing protein
MTPLVLSRSSRPSEIKKPDAYHKVKVTMYTIDPAQTDSTPLITASGFKLDSINPKRHRIIAVSRDLKRKYKFGTKVMIEGIGKWSGVYTIRDVMNKRFTKKIDILINPEDRAISFRSAILYPLDFEKK